jgi:hypothetical protein
MVAGDAAVDRLGLRGARCARRGEAVRSHFASPFRAIPKAYAAISESFPPTDNAQALRGVLRSSC